MGQIQYQKGDIFDSKAQVIVNTVNCKGVMGKGLALCFKERYPDMFRVYQEECRTGRLRIGRPTLYKASIPWILNFPTKDHWRFPSKLSISPSCPSHCALCTIRLPACVAQPALLPDVNVVENVHYAKIMSIEM